MYAQENQQAMSIMMLFLVAGGWLYLSFGIVTTIWGLINLMRSARPTAIYSQMCVSLVPSLIALFVIYSTYGDFQQMAISTEPPKPTDFAAVCTRGMAHGFWGILSTVVPLMLGLATAWRRHRAAFSSAAPTNS